MLRWIFLDVGNVLINDDPTMALLYRELHRALCVAGYSIPFSDLLLQREDLIRQRGPEHWNTLGRRYLGEQGHLRLMMRCASRIRQDYMRYHAVIPGMLELVERLAASYRIGVVANQLKEVVTALGETGFGRFVSVHAVSESVGLRKPDPAFYRWAVDQAGCRPEEALMVGDRCDNDIAPARAIGMWTVLYQMKHKDKGYTPSGEMESMYFASQLRESICSIPPRTPEQTPDAFASTPQGLEEAIERIRALAATTDSAPPRR